MPATVFISHSNHDAHDAIELASKLNRAGFFAWTYETCLKFSKSIREEVQRYIEDADVFIVVDSESARASGWVARELELATRLQKRRGGRMPIVVFYQLKDDLPETFVRRGFQSALPQGRMSLKDTRRFCEPHGHTDQIDTLIEMITPEIRFFGERKGDSESMPEGWEDCYEALFPIEDERDHPTDIMFWMEQAAEDPASDWEELVGTLTFVDYVVGFIFLSMHKPTGWIFGNYFGLRGAWRHHNWAKRFRDAVDAHIFARLPNARGALFEVESFSDAVAAKAVRGIRAGRRKLRSDELPHARSIRRAFLYQVHGARVLMETPSTPAFYKQPYMYEQDEFPGTIDRTAEVPLMLMMYPLGQPIDPVKHDPKDAIAFIYRHVFKDAYGGHPTYDAYIEEVCADVLGRLGPGAYWGKLTSTAAKDLVMEIKRNKIEAAL